MMTTRPIALLLVLLFVALLPTRAEAKPQELLDGKARIDLKGGWARTSLEPGFGDDQFADKKAFRYLLVLPTDRLLLDEADFRVVTDALTEAVAQPEAVGESTFTRRKDGFGHLSVPFTARVNGLWLAYQAEVVARDSVGVVLLFWTFATRKDELVDVTGEVLDSLVFDKKLFGPKAVTTHEGRVGEARVSARSRDALVTAVPDEQRGDSVIGLTSPDEALYVWILPSEGSVEEVHRWAVNQIAEEGGTSELMEEREVQLGEAVGQLQVTEIAQEGASQVLACAVVPYGEEQVIDVRVGVSGSWDAARQAVVNELLDGVEIVLPPTLDAYPPLPEVEPEAPWVHPALEPLLEAARSIGPAKGWGKVGVNADGSLTVVSDGSLLRVTLDEGAEPEVLRAVEGWGYTGAVLADGSLLLRKNDEASLTTPDGEVHVVEPPSAASALPSGGAVLAFEAQTEPRLGFSAARIGAPRIEFGPDLLGTRETIHLPVGVVDGLTVSGDGTRVLVSGIEGGNDRWAAVRVLVEVELATGAARVLPGRWRWVRGVGPAPEGWVVGGRPEGGPEGVYLIAAGGSATPWLLAPDVTPVAATEDEVLVQASWDRSGSTLFGVPRDAVPPDGVRALPAGARDMLEIARAASEVLGVSSFAEALADEASLDRFLGAADEAARARLGAPLPRDAEAFDRLARRCTSEDATVEALWLLSALFTRVLLDSGAQWVAGDGPPSSMQTWTRARNEFAVGVDPVGLIVNTLWDSEGIWAPMESVTTQADGRAMLLGVHAERVREAVAAARDGGWRTRAEEGDATAIAELLDRHPDNLFLRRAVWEALAGADRYDVLAEVSEDWAGKEAPAPDDVIAWLAGRAAGFKGKRAYNALVEDLRDALSTHPNQPRLLMVLADVYRRGPSKDALALSRACLTRAQADAGAWSSDGKAVQDALDALNAEEETTKEPETTEAEASRSPSR